MWLNRQAADSQNFHSHLSSGPTSLLPWTERCFLGKIPSTCYECWRWWRVQRRACWMEKNHPETQKSRSSPPAPAPAHWRWWNIFWSIKFLKKHAILRCCRHMWFFICVSLSSSGQHWTGPHARAQAAWIPQPISSHACEPAPREDFLWRADGLPLPNFLPLFIAFKDTFSRSVEAGEKMENGN